MTSISERLSFARPQWQAQLDAFHTLGTRALDSAEQVLALNLKMSRASIEQASGTVQQMLQASDPRTLFALAFQPNSQVQNPWQHFLTYQRELMGIALGARERGWASISVPAAAAPLQLSNAQAAADSTVALAEDTLGVGDQSGADAAAALPPAGQIVPATAAQPDTRDDAPTELDAEKTGETPSETPAEEPVHALAAAVTSPEDETSANVAALVDIVIADDVPPAKTKPLVEALNDVAAKPAGTVHPIVSTVPLEAAGHIDLPLVTPTDATPPVQLSNGPAPSERRRGTRKK
jgi:hypothetical protein